MAKFLYFCYHVCMISRKKILNYLAIILIFLAIVNILAIDFGWYYIYSWFDMFTHFLGGLGSLFFIWYIFFGKFFRIKNIFLTSILCVIAIGVLWELYEFFVINIWAGHPFNLKDTIFDLIFDTLGGLLGFLMIKNNGDKGY